MQSEAKKIALLCARPPEQNTGMVTVDLAGKSLFSKAFPDAEVTLYYYGAPDLLPYAGDTVPLRYRDAWADREAFLAADCRVVWGDFTHSASLWMPARESWPADAAAPTRENIAAISFLRGQDEDLFARTISYGGTVITNNAGVFRDELYRSAFTGFYTKARCALLRDAISAAAIAEYRPSGRTLGIDCAFLNTNDNLSLLKDFAEAGTRDRLGVFFGRTPGFANLLRFARKLGEGSGIPLQWVPWFHTRRRDRLRARALGFRLLPEQPSPGAALSVLSGCGLVVTDTYHLAINAWRMGIPAICVGVGAGPARNSLSDKKKEILYKMYAADELYVFAENLANGGGRTAAARIALDRALDESFVDIEKQRNERHRALAQYALLSAARDILV